MELWLLAFMKIMLINLILSGDNAVVIAMASRQLPEAKRRLAIFWGAFGAIILRILLTLVAIQLLQIPYLMSIGALLLFWVAVRLLIDQEDEKTIQASQQLGMVVMTIVMADFVMSMDNVIAIAAIAQGDFLLITLGLTLSIPIIIWGSSAVLILLDRFPIVLYIGAAVLGFTAGEMLLGDERVAPAILNVVKLPHWFISVLTALVAILIGWIMKRPLLNRTL